MQMSSSNAIHRAGFFFIQRGNVSTGFIHKIWEGSACATGFFSGKCQYSGRKVNRKKIGFWLKPSWADAVKIFESVCWHLHFNGLEILMHTTHPTFPMLPGRIYLHMIFPTHLQQGEILRQMHYVKFWLGVTISSSRLHYRHGFDAIDMLHTDRRFYQLSRSLKMCLYAVV